MAADVALAQALAYARDLRALYEVSRAREEEANPPHDKLRAAYKQGPLTDEEWIAMRRHPLTGAQIVAPLEFFADAALIVRHHHERHDGSGYPDGLKGDGIPVGARIVAIADVYDALTSERPYRRKLAREEAVQAMRDDAGLTLEPRLSDPFPNLVIDARADVSVVSGAPCPAG